MSTEPHAPSTQRDDAANIAAMVRGDASALGLLYDRHAQSLLVIARRIVSDWSEAEDVVHQVFLEAWRHAADYDSARGTVLSWLRLRTRSRSIDARSSGRSKHTVFMPNDNWLQDVHDPRGDGALLPDHARVRRALDNLPEEQRHYLKLSYFEGLSQSEIAERVGIPLGTVKSRVSAAISGLRIALADNIDGAA